MSGAPIVEKYPYRNTICRSSLIRSFPLNLSQITEDSTFRSERLPIILGTLESTVASLTRKVIS
jgi:hypothetical protein